MSSWNETLIGLTLVKGDIGKLNRFLKTIGVEPGTRIIGEVSKLHRDFSPAISGKIKKDFTGIEESLNRFYADYVKENYPFLFYEDEEYSENENEKTDHILQPDELFDLVKSLFPSVDLYIAQEIGNNTDDTYYRLERIYNSETGLRKTGICFYSYGCGINTDTDNPKEEGTEFAKDIVMSGVLNKEIISRVISRAKENGFLDIVEDLIKYA